MLVGPLLPADLSAAAALEAGATRHPWTERALRDSLQGNHLCLKATFEGRVAGYGVLRLAGEECELLNLAVGKPWQGQGVGGRLLEVLLEEAAAAGAEECYLEVRASNRAAKRFYEKRFFIVTGRRRGYYRSDAGREDALLMRRYL